MSDDNKNELRIDLTGNPGVAAYFSDKKPGDKCEFTLNTTVKEIDPANDVVLGINKLIHEDDAGEEKELTPSADEPMKMEVTGGDDEGAEGELPADVSIGDALRVATKGAMKEKIKAGAY